MSSFSIEILRQPEFNSEIRRAAGRITIGNFSENFQMDMSFWVTADYLESWRRAFGRLASCSVVDSCLLTSVVDPKYANFIECWPLYRVGDVVYVQNAIIIPDELSDDFNLDEPWLSIRHRETVDEDGNLLSEWEASMNSIREFFVIQA